ncbi:hypothetical protein EFK68_03890 [Pseudomonas aeruginosa]|uniref:hypothetical protein n=1 Tax=Pseudomonas aeruginosa TaxID=287 RepID=UPI00093C6B6E|nr:hypothetical protein [Pseudomonas aeruginosa]EIU2701796.1 hypothetical protein [Pseudomonas aeruginosa]EKF7416916.1 hypothetical protein [Pseudomonas aeruginosa]EKW9641041.1 hypothetical protein [Pseudomonas aeruginosa]NRC34141.1 hypothetical protein [Pseudomonas aeruginosa]RNF58519.1 hypothetical protein EFK68_03890 [Pseudomonas aeruginosa]
MQKRSDTAPQVIEVKTASGTKMSIQLADGAGSGKGKGFLAPTQKCTFEPVPIIDGPWQGGSIQSSLGTFEIADDEPLEFANPLSLSPPGVQRTRYYRQHTGSGWVWSVRVPENASELLQIEAEEAAALLPD